MRRIHGVEDILLGFEPKDAGSIPAGSVFTKTEMIARTASLEIRLYRVIRLHFSTVMRVTLSHVEEL